MNYPVMNGSEHFQVKNQFLSATVKDFWAWSMSRLLADGPRSDLAEFIVNTALGQDTKSAKHGWGECDIIYNNFRIEVKCSSLIQAWDRKSPTKPVFSIRKTLNCDIEETDTGYCYVGRDHTPAKRRSEIYVFCLFSNTDRSTADPLNLDQWQFYIVPTKVLDEKCADTKTIGINGLSKLGFSPVGYHELKPLIDSYIGKEMLR